MAAIPGSVRVTGFIGPTDSTDTYAVTDAKYGRDGLRNVADNTERNAITADRRRQGMVVGTDSDGKYWYLKPSPWNFDDTDWELFLDPIAGSAYGLWDLFGNDIRTSPALNSPAAPNVLPANDSLQDLGSALYRWKDLYLDGIINFNTELYFVVGGASPDDSVLRLDSNGAKFYTGKTISSFNGGGQLDLDYGGTAGDVLLSVDNGAYNKSQLYLGNGYVELSNYDTAGAVGVFADVLQLVSGIVATPGNPTYALLADGNVGGLVHIQSGGDTMIYSTGTTRIQTGSSDNIASFDSTGITVHGLKGIKSDASPLQIDLNWGGGGDQFYLTTDNGLGFNTTYMRLKDGPAGDFEVSFGDGLGTGGAINISNANAQFNWSDNVMLSSILMTSGGLGLSHTYNISLTSGTATVTVDSALNKTVINPQLDVTGAFYYNDGNEAAGRVLVTDGTGLAIWSDPASGLPQGVMETIPVGTTVTVPANYQYLVYGNLTIDGTLINNGHVVIVNGALVVNLGGTFTNNATLEYVTFQTGTNDSKYSQTFTTVANTPLTITHNLNTTDFIYSVKEGVDFIDAQVTIVDANSITVTTTTAVTGKINIIGF